MSVNIKVTGGLNIEWGQIDPKVTGGLRVLAKTIFFLGFPLVLCFSHIRYTEGHQ